MISSLPSLLEHCFFTIELAERASGAPDNCQLSAFAVSCAFWRHATSMSPTCAVDCPCRCTLRQAHAQPIVCSGHHWAAIVIIQLDNDALPGTPGAAPCSCSSIPKQGAGCGCGGSRREVDTRRGSPGSISASWLGWQSEMVAFVLGLRTAQCETPFVNHFTEQRSVV